MKKKQLLFVCLVLLLEVPGSLSAQEQKTDLEALYQQLDEAIENSPNYVKLKEKEINRVRLSFLEAKEPEQRFVLAEELFALFKPFKNDSAINYARICVEIANSLKRPDLAGHYHSLLARQCSNASMYVESLDQLQQVDKTALDRQGLTDYYDAWMHVCGEIAAYSLIPEVKSQYYAMQDHYRDSVMMVADEGSDEYLHLKMSMLCARQEYQEALKVSNQWLNKVSEGTHADAYAAYYRHIVYDKLGNGEMVRFWLAKSALDDIKCAVMDQASLITLAELLNYDGDLNRSYKYIRFTWRCNDFFNTRLRSSQIAPVLSVIEKNYTSISERNTLILTVSVVIFCLMALCLLIMFRYVSRQKKCLADAQQELTNANEQLQTANKKLTKMNERVKRYNKQLFDINHDLLMEKEQMQQEILKHQQQ